MMGIQIDIQPLRYLRLWYTIGYCLVALVIYLSLSSKTLSIGVNYGDKILHGFAYATLMGWFLQIYTGYKARLFIAACFIALGATLEFLQALNPIRYFDLWDMLANAVGVSLAWALGFTPLAHVLLGIERLIEKSRIS